MKNYKDLLLYWIKERYEIFLKKEAGVAAPWSTDPVFQTTYFCNVHRENDRVTRWIRNFYSPEVAHPMFEYNIILARLLNRPTSLAALGYQREHAPAGVVATLEGLVARGDVIWGSAYIITTHGQRMGKLAYLAQVLSDAHRRLESLRSATRGRSCIQAYTALRGVPGLGSFLAGQVVADLKNTPHHPLAEAHDFKEFVVPGPGSLRGASWFHYGQPDRVTPARFPEAFAAIRHYVDEHWPETVPPVHNQDLQNCLCEYDKYVRVKTGSGRSKRGYNGR